jgi:hypothetical protein
MESSCLTVLQRYCVNQGTAIQVLQDIRSKNVDVAQLLTVRETAPILFRSSPVSSSSNYETIPSLAISTYQVIFSFRVSTIVKSSDDDAHHATPVQRITRYKLLINQIIQYTPEGKDRPLIESSLESAEALLASINESIRMQEGRARLQAISKDLFVGRLGYGSVRFA